MAIATFFEHQRRSYSSLGWDADHLVVDQLDRLNVTCGAELVRLGRGHLQATQFVGVIRVGDSVLQILPKIDADPTGDAEAHPGSIPYQSAVHSATRNLLHLLSYTHDLQIKEQDLAPLLAQRSDWFELLTRLLAMDLHRLMQRGLEHAYLRREESLPVMRGRWQIERQLTRRPHTHHIFDVAYDEFSLDTYLNQTFRFVASCLLRSTQDGGNRRLLADVHRWLDGVEDLPAISPVHLERVHFTRLNERFRPAFNLARLFLENSALQLAAGRHDTFAFVFDMNILFEEFVYRFIERHRARILPDEWVGVLVQPKSRGQSIYLAERLPHHHPVFRLIPDLLFARPSGHPVLIADTKYKQLVTNQGRLGIAEADAYQMLAYALTLRCPRCLLLYPSSPGALPGLTVFNLRAHPAHVVAATVNLHQPLDQPNGMIADLKTLLEEVARYGPLAAVPTSV